MLVDSHCHLDFPDFADDLDAIVARAETAGIGRIVTISTRVKRLGGLLAIAERFPNVYCSVGTHPHQADEEDGIPAERTDRTDRHPKVVALGEAGLDYFYEHGSREAQERGFRAHIAAARATGLPLVIHTREADDDCGRILEDEIAKGPFRAVLHCYTGGRELAMKAIALGLSISFTGILTFKKSRSACANSPPNSRPIASWSKPTRPIWRRANFAASATSRPMSSKSQRCWQKRAASRWRRFRGRPRKTSSGCSPKCRAEGCGMTVTLTILGCGSSAGVPRPALGWGACDPKNPKNRRRRCSLLVERTRRSGTTRIVIDTSPDLREQLIDAEVDHIDAVYLTHEHADQTHGIDDLRSVVLHQRRRIPVYFNQSTAKDIMARFSYCFISPEGSDYPPILTRHSIEAGESRETEGKGGPVKLSAFLVHHGRIPALGYRIGAAAYTPDLHDIPAESWPLLENLDLWIVDGLRYAGHPSHFSVNDALSWIERFKPKRAVLTNMHSDLDYEVMRQSLPAGVIPAYDGMRLELG